jgi:hypothetical protein
MCNVPVRSPQRVWSQEVERYDKGGEAGLQILKHPNESESPHFIWRLPKRSILLLR